MIFNYFQPNLYNLNKDTEINIHNNIKFWNGKEGEFGNFAKLAKFALENGYTVDFFYKKHFCPSFMKKNIYKRYMSEYEKYLSIIKSNSCFKLHNRDFSVEDILTELQKGKLVLVEIKYPDERTTHNVVVRGFSKSFIFLADPIKGFIKKSKSEFGDVIDVAYSKNFISFIK